MNHAAGPNLSRPNNMRQANDLKAMRLPLLLDGITVT